jgi:hypothetical protein
MKHTLACLLLLLSPAWATLPDLTQIRSNEELESALTSVRDEATRKALQEHAPALLSAAQRYPHVQEVARIVESAHGKVERYNTTPEMLRKQLGADLPVFDALKLVDLSVPNTGPHDKRSSDPYDAAFFQHLAQLHGLESLNIISTKATDEWIAPLGKLESLKILRFTNNGKLSDIGLAALAGLKNMEAFSYVGTGMKGHAFVHFQGWDKLVKCSFRGSSIDDIGLQNICERFPHIESMSLAHAKFTDAGAAHLAKLSRLKGLELGSKNATPSCLNSLASLPLEYLQLGDGLDTPAGITACKEIHSLKRLTLTHCEHLDDTGLQCAAALTQLEQLEIGGLTLSAERVPQLAAFHFLKELKLIRRPQSYPEEIQSQVKTLLPQVSVKFQ